MNKTLRSPRAKELDSLRERIQHYKDKKLFAHEDILRDKLEEVLGILQSAIAKVEAADVVRPAGQS